MGQVTASWRMWAHDNDGEFQHIGQKWWVDIHGLPDPIVPVTVTEVPADSPDGTHWGWVNAKDADGKPCMMWAFRGAFDMQFPYGPEAEEKAGKGRVVRLAITRREPEQEEETP